jgi:isopenicillin N synthase-like dioxygenase
MPDTIPIIDLAGLTDAEAAAQIGHACRGRGFFYVINHGVPEALRARMFATAADFFALPEPVKAEVSITRSPHNRGYIAMEQEKLDPSRPGDAKEIFNIGRDLAPDDPDVRAGTPFHGVNLWPAMPGFRETAMAYFNAVQSLGERLHRAFAIDLGLKPDFFAPLIDRPLATLRILHYPPHPGAFDGTQYGAAPHTDYGNVTILAQDDVGGLEVQARDGAWINAVPIPGAFICNIGDCLMRWSNDIYVSTPHRVVNRTGRERYSIAFFLDPNADAPVECLPGCGDAPKYPPTTGAAYLRERLDRTYDHRRETAA